MVLGLRSKNRKGLPVQLDYLVHVQEIKPWPPSPSLRYIQSVVLYWEIGDRSSGYLTTNVIDGKVEFGESFRLPVKLYRESSRKGVGFQKNNLAFNLYELQKEKAVRGQLLGSAVINLADHGVITEIVSIHAPISAKKSGRNALQPPVLYATIQSFDGDSSCSSPKSSLLKEESLDQDGSESVSEVTKEVIDDGSEITPFTDDDDDDFSAHSSQSSHSFALKSTEVSPGQNDKPVALNLPSGLELAKDDTGRINREHTLSRHVALNPEVNIIAEARKDTNVSSPHQSSTGLSTVKLRDPVSDIAANVVPPDVQSSLGISSKSSSFEVPEINQMDEKALSRERNGLEETIDRKPYTDGWKNKEEKEQQKNGRDRELLDMEKCHLDDHIDRKLPRDAAREKVNLRSNTLVFNRSLEVSDGTLMNNKLKHVNSAQFESARSNGLSRNSQLLEKAAKVDVPGGMNNGNIKATREREERPSSFSDNRDELKSKVEMLEEELKEAAALEVGLYSVVAEHGGSTSKVHAPVRRLSRFYFHACKAKSKARSASAARAVVSGLLLVSKACGNDVPRLTFWLSNSIVLRAIISQSVSKSQLSSVSLTQKLNNERGETKGSSPKSMLSSPHEEKNDMIEGSDEWEEPQIFVVALEKIEAWIFSRIIESVWWQTLTPHMQSSAVKSTNIKKSNARMHGLGDEEQGNFAIDLWKKAFKDACERLCPVRASGHECGCLPLLARLVMEQLVDRLDVAMFNAILRESAEEMPTDPVSDPISDAKVLPIPAGKSSFGAGAQLKNAVGNWSRFLTDLFGIDDNEVPNNENESDDKGKCETPFKAFHLLNALSDLMMLPFEMLTTQSARKEVCPTFGAPMIKRVLINFVPDEFNPQPIPEDFLDSLDSEDFSDDEEVSITNFPCTAAPIVYTPPPTSNLTSIIGEVGNQTLLRSGSTLLKKAYTSDDELDELDAPITSIDISNLKVSPSTAPNWTPQGNRGRKVVRYHLLREVWRDSE